MKDDTELVALERESFVACCRARAEAAPEGSVRDRPGSFAFVTGLPLPMFNGCVVTDPGPASEVGAALAWLAEHDVPHTLCVPGEVSAEVDALAAAHGLAREPQPLPGMVPHPVPVGPPLPPGLVVEPVRNGREGDVARVVVGLGLGDETAAQLTSRSFSDPPGTVALQASPMGLPVYRSMGFETVVEYTECA